MAEAGAGAFDWIAAARAVSPQIRPFINGARVDARTDASFTVENAYSAERLATLSDCGAEDVDEAVRSARSAFERGSWSAMPPTERGAVLRRLADLIDGNRDLAILQSLQMGMPVAVSWPDMTAAANVLRDAAELADQLHDVAVPGAHTSIVLEIRRPQGVVAIISPWNFPLGVALTMVAPALAAGNSVVLKPSEIAPLECLALASLAAEAGLPPGVLNVLPGTGGNTGRLLALHADVDMISFTGSTATGQRLLQYSGQSNMKALVLECGGKSPQIVFDDLGDIETLADVLVEGFSFNSGQLCTSHSRTLIAASLYDRLVPLLIDRVNGAATGNPLVETTRLGPLANRSQATKVRGMIAGADHRVSLIARGSTGDRPNEVAPHLFEATDQDAPLVQDEVFGPTTVVTPFRDEAEAIRLANGTRYGLSASVFASDIALSHRLLPHLRSGVVLANRVPRPKSSGVRFVTVEPVKMSGFGAHGGARGLATYTRVQAAILNMA